MFKKYVPSGSHTSLLKSDVKKLKKSACEVLGVADVDLGCLVPAKTVQVVVTAAREQSVGVLCGRPALFFVFRRERRGGAGVSHGVHAVAATARVAVRGGDVFRGMPESFTCLGVRL